MPQPPMLKKLKLTGSVKTYWNAKVGSQEISRITGKFGLRVQYESQQRLTEFCQENTLVIANTLFQQYNR